MKAFVTGGTGFIGSRLVRRLRERGDEVVALVRSPEKATELREQGCELVEGDLSSEQAIRDGVQGCDAVFHVAAVYKVGIPASQREDMWDSNVRGTERVLDAAIDAGVPRIVYVSTVGVFGNTHGQVVDEDYRHPGEDFLSCYEETKYRSHQVALDRIAKGAPIVIVQPGGVYGPGDHSEIGNIIDQTRTGKLKMLMFPETGFNLVHVDDVADGHRARARQGRGGGVVRARRRDLEDEDADREGGGDLRPQGAEARAAGRGHEGGDPDRAAGRQGDGLPAEPAGVDPHVRRRHLLGDGRQGAT